MKEKVVVHAPAHPMETNAHDALPSVSRRNFLKTSAIWAGSVWVIGFAPVSDSEYQILTPEEAEIMDALADCIIPPGAFAGGKDAGVTHFIDQQLGGYLHRDKGMYKTCLPALNTGCRSDYGKHFTELDDEQQVRYLTDIEAGEYNDRLGTGGTANGNVWGEYMPSNVFNAMRDHSMMGFYGHPRHGGNKEWVSYQMLGLSVDRVR